MIKYFCDRCGSEMTKEKRHGFVSVNTRDKAEGELLEENEFESWLFCKKCTEDIRRYVRTLPLKPSQNEEKRDQNEEKRTVTDESGTKSKENGAETEVHMSRIEPTKRPKL